MDIAGAMAQGARDNGSNPFKLTGCFGQGKFSGLADILGGHFSGQGVQQGTGLDPTGVKVPIMVPGPIAFGGDWHNLDVGAGAIAQFLHRLVR